jgi:hypothetical protein
MEMLVEIAPLNVGTGSRVTMRLASAMDKRIVALNGQRWWPAIKRKAAMSHQFFDGDFTGQIGTGGASFQVSMFALKRLDANAAGYRYARAPVTIYAAEPGTAWPWPVLFKGVVDRFGNADETLQLDCVVDATPFDVSALTQTYAGTGGIEGPADLKNKVKPWCFGRARGVEPVLIDAVNGVYQVSAYGPINGVTALYERAASFGASVGDFATYAALVAASIPAGRWGTCLASGLIRLGAPAFGIITADVEGDRPGGVYLRRTGAIISRLCSNAGVASGNINAASIAALDTWAATLPDGGNINLYLTEQVKLNDLIERLVRPCNAMSGVSWAGELFACRFGAIGTPATTLDVQGRQLPPVKECAEEPVSPPYARIEMGGDRCWRTHAANEIAFNAEIIERGDYDAGTSYREGNIVVHQGARWLYINPTATAGNTPPTLPTASNSFWSLLSNRTDFANLVGNTKPEDNATAADNLVSNAGLQIDAAGWVLSAGVARQAGVAGSPAPGLFVFQPFFFETTAQFNLGLSRPLPATGRLFVRVWSLRGTGTTGRFDLEIYWQRADGSDASPAFTATSIRPTVDGLWTLNEFVLTPPVGAVAFSGRISASDQLVSFYAASGLRIAVTEAAADVTAQNTAADVVAVAGTPAATVIADIGTAQATADAALATADAALATAVFPIVPRTITAVGASPILEVPIAAGGSRSFAAEVFYTLATGTGITLATPLEYRIGTGGGWTAFGGGFGDTDDAPTTLYALWTGTITNSGADALNYQVRAVVSTSGGTGSVDSTRSKVGPG